MKVLPAAIAVALAAACGGEPVGAKVPRPNPSAVAVGAAAAAGALTLADPNSSGKKPEVDSAESLRGKKTSGETVPAGVLDRAEAGGDSALPLCSEVEARRKREAAQPRVELVPVSKPERCRPDDDDDDDDVKDDDVKDDDEDVDDDDPDVDEDDEEDDDD